MFRRALATLSFMSKDVLAGKVQLLRDLGFSQDDISMIAKKAPLVLAKCDTKIQQAMEFLMRDVGLQASYIAQRPVLIMYSREKRLVPRRILLHLLRHKGLLNVGHIPSSSLFDSLICFSLVNSVEYRLGLRRLSRVEYLVQFFRGIEENNS